MILAGLFPKKNTTRRAAAVAPSPAETHGEAPDVPRPRGETGEEAADPEDPAREG